MKGQHFYDPQIGDSEPMQIRGFEVSIGGTYVLMSDVVVAIRGYAQSLESPDAGALVHEVANWLQSGEAIPPAIVAEVPAVVEGPPVGAEPDDSHDVERVEIFPDAEGKWYARSIDSQGNILKTTHGSFDKQWVTRNASERWVGISIYEVATPMDDSQWQERGRIGPSPKRLFAGVGA